MLKSISGGTNALEKAINGEELSYDDGLDLMVNENLFLLGAAPDRIRKKVKGENITFVASYYLNYTNICAASCPLCAFYRKGDESDSYTLSTEQISTRARIAIKEMGADRAPYSGRLSPYS